ncbi:FtsK/SpoIIIE domain-containing protein [Microbulbifer sp. Q7]|uniref:FtsK/SpoIIIE domain-containing protein n=1 Tax=Microbulbifer sp. Q7 TaxID=1785091 RepID=UPI000AF1B5C3|nr:FtsK/SpoIIIE domain-containing protein [Microbulbifer sp. Q7]
MIGIESIIGNTAFVIVARSFLANDSADRNSFRLKNLTRHEALAFLEVWKRRRTEWGLGRVTLLVASDSHQDFPSEFRADPDHSITYYRNNNDHGLVYIETKEESDEQGLKNLFTLRDVNFLDGTFDEDGKFLVPEEMFRQALLFEGSPKAEGYELLRDRLVEVLRELNSVGVPIPVRKFAGFLLAVSKEVVTVSSAYSPEEINALVGRCLVHLDMFPDEAWRKDPGNVARRLSLNLLRSELAASTSSDLDPEKAAQDCVRTKFEDEEGVQYEAGLQAYWRESCAEYCRGPSRERRERIPYRIFEQVFRKDVKGLPLGQRVAGDIVHSDPSRKSEFDELSVEGGLDNRSPDDARRFLESEASEASILPLKDLLSKQTLRMVEKLASPAVERIENPLIKLSQVASDFRARTSFDGGSLRIDIRTSAATSERHTPSLGLFAFLYGQSLLEISSSLADGLGSVSLNIDTSLTRQIPVPHLKEEIDPEIESSEAGSSEEDEGVIWLPVPLEFVLVNTEDEVELDSEVTVEWLPRDLHYLALFWISVCGEDRNDLIKESYAPLSPTGEAWIEEVVHRLLPFKNGRARPISEEVLHHPVISRLVDIRSNFRAEVEKNGLSSGLLNDVFDEWSTLLAEARTSFIPEGHVPSGMVEFLNADCVQEFDGDRVLMLQSHPLKLRWMAAYLAKSKDLAADAIEGSLRLNEQNETLYLSWIQGLSPHQQPPILTSTEGHILFAAGERGWAESFQPNSSSGGTVSAGKIHASIISEVGRQITAYLHSHPYKADGLKILVVSSEASSLPADLVQAVRKAEFKNLAMTIDFVAPKSCWQESARQFELVDTDNRLAGDGALFPPVQLNFHDLDKVKEDADAALDGQIFDLAIVPQFLDDNIIQDTKTEDQSGVTGKFDPLLDDPTYIASGAGSSALWVSLRPQVPDIALADWSTLVVRHDRKSPVASDRPEATDFIDLRINFHNAARFFGVLHKCSHWVITIERHITREQIEKLETRPAVLSIRDKIGPGGLFTLIVSSNAGRQFITDRLTRKLKRVAASIGRTGLAERQAHFLANKIYEEARQISPRLTLDALGISRVTEEVLGLSIARQVADRIVPLSITDGFIAWISLDEHPEWFVSATSMRADMVRLAVNLVDDSLSVDVLVLESKLRRSGYEAHGAEQVLKTLKMFDSIFPKVEEQDAMDGKLWRDSLLSAVDTVSEDALVIQSSSDSNLNLRSSKVSDEIRSRFREGDFSSVNIGGLYSICEYSHSRSMTVQVYEADPRVQVVKTGGSALLDGPPAPASLALENEKEAAQLKRLDKQRSSFISKDGNDEEARVHVYEPPVPASQVDSSGTEPSEDALVNLEGNTGGPCDRGRLGWLELDRRYQIILDTFGRFGINVNRTLADVDHAIEGPASVLYRVKPGNGVEARKLYAQHDALKLALELESSQDLQFGIDKGYVTIDVPKSDADRYFVAAQDLWSRWQRPVTGLVVPLGEDRFGNIVEIDFASSNSPHLLIGGTTGSGKSEALNTLLAGIVGHYSPKEVRLQLIDPKGTELEPFSGCKHLDGEIGWDEEDAIKILARAVEEMQVRFSNFKKAKVRSIDDYNEQVSEENRIQRWVIVLDEYADLTSEPETKKIIEAHLKRLAQKARQAAIHVIIATQKPDATVISTNLRSNLPAQLALRVKSATESRVIMDDPGAEALTGKGDAFFKESGVLTRVQCAKI